MVTGITGWGKLLQPNVVLGDSVLAITPELIERYGLRGLVLDVDETLVPISETDTTEEVQRWLQQMRSQVSLWLVSNNLSVSRIRRIAETLDVPYVTGAGKPSRRKLRRAAQDMNLPVHQVAMVGDRLFTDVLAGNRLGMFTILVEPMVSPTSKPSRRQPLRALEVCISRLLGVTFKAYRG